MASSQWQVIPCPSALRHAALQWLQAALPRDQQAVFLQAVNQAGPLESSAWDDLLVLTSNSSSPGGLAGLTAERIEGVLWIQPLAGNTSYVWSPPGDSAAMEQLLLAAGDFIDQRRTPLAQLVVGPDDGYSPELLSRAGFPKFAELVYLYADASPTKFAPSVETARRMETVQSGQLQFTPFAAEQPTRLSRVLEQTYVDTLDCPGLEGVRTMDDVLEGYRAQGRHSPEDWYFIQTEKGDVGALILAEHPEAGNSELVYMGLVPSARGRGLAQQIIIFAIETAEKRGAERLVVAVDAANEPAVAAYRRAGFVVWDRRIVYARLQAQS